MFIREQGYNETLQKLGAISRESIEYTMKALRQSRDRRLYESRSRLPSMFNHRPTLSQRLGLSSLAHKVGLPSDLRGFHAPNMDVAAEKLLNLLKLVRR